MNKDDYMKLPKERLAELLAEKDAKDEFAGGIYKGYFPTVPTIIAPQPPCYTSDGICINPQMDCINCPKRGVTGGTWATNTGGTINTTNKNEKV